MNLSIPKTSKVLRQVSANGEGLARLNHVLLAGIGDLLTLTPTVFFSSLRAHLIIIFIVIHHGDWITRMNGFVWENNFEKNK